MMSVNDELIDRYLDRDVSDREAAEVLAWLQIPENMDRFASRAELHVDLRRSLRRRSIQSRAVKACTDGSSIVPSASVSANKSTALGVIALAVAVCLLITLGFPRDDHQPNPSQPILATVVSEIDAMLSKSGSQWQGTALSAGDYQLTQGLLHLQFDGGVMVYVEAPATFDAVSAKRIVLHAGRVSASVPPEGIGFTVETPEAKVVDFGTEFSVEVGHATSEVHVFDGLVRVQPRAGKVERADAIDLRTAQAVRIDDTSPNPFGITLASNRFIRNFDEPRRNYARSVKQLTPVAFYRMPIRDRGLVSEPPQYSGEVFTGDGKRPPHAKGVFAGGSLRVRADSTGRGGRVNSPPPLTTGKFTLSAFVYLESPTAGGTVATNIRDAEGNFGLSLDTEGRLRATVRNHQGQLKSFTGDNAIPLVTWLHIVITADGEQLRMFENGNLVASTPCETIAHSMTAPISFGTDSNRRGLWNGRIDEVAIFDKALSERQIADLYQAALDELARSE